MVVLHGYSTEGGVWAHNSHPGDARATELGRAGELNVGQLVRERYGQEAVLVGFSTYSGTVTAASECGGPAERKRVRPALPKSYEALFHAVGLPCFLFVLRPGLVVAYVVEPEYAYIPPIYMAANQASAALQAVQVRGTGHEFWVDAAAGFRQAEQDALVHYLLR